VNGNLYGYASNNFYVHAPSEHTIEGVQYALELEIVFDLKQSDFSNPTQSKAILSIMFQVDNTQPTNAFFNAWNPSTLDSSF